jgi:hypothetical protein
MIDNLVDQIEDKPPGTAWRPVVFVLLIVLLTAAVLGYRASQAPLARLKLQLDDQARLLGWQFDASRAAVDGPSREYWAAEFEKTQKKIDALKASIAEAEGRR